MVQAFAVAIVFFFGAGVPERSIVIEAPSYDYCQARKENVRANIMAQDQAIRDVQVVCIEVEAKDNS